MDMIATNLVALAVLKATLGGILEDNGKPVPTYFPDYVTAIQSAGNFQNRYVVTTIEGQVTKDKTTNKKMHGGWLYSNRFYLPDATSIPTECFLNRGDLVEVVAPNVTSIGNSAFEGCTMLKTVKFSDNITYIGSDAFKGCVSLKSEINAPGVSMVKDGAFRGCHMLKKITLSNQLHYIGNNAFQNCWLCDFSHLDFTYVTNIGYKAFYNTSISQTPVSPEVTGISRRNVKDYAFYGSALADPFFATNTVAGISSFARTKLRSVEFADCWDRAFSASSITNFMGVANRGICMNCKDLVTVTFGSSSVEADAFRGCSSLKTLLNTGDVEDSIGEGAFAGCISLSNITFENLGVCYEGCFSACTNLEALLLPSVTQFHAVFIPKYYADSEDEDEMLAKREAARKDGGVVNFAKLTKLTTLSLPSVQQIGAFAFGISETEQLTNIMDLYLPHLTTAQIKAMDTYPYWFLHPSCIIHASDGNFTYGN